MKEQHDFEISFFEGILKRNPRYVEVIEILGSLYTKKGMIDEGLRMDRKLVRLQPNNPTAHYNLGCSLALKSRQADAIRSLQKAVELGYNDSEWMQEDPDLASLHQHPQFQKLLQMLKKQSKQS